MATWIAEQIPGVNHDDDSLVMRMFGAMPVGNVLPAEIGHCASISTFERIDYC